MSDTTFTPPAPVTEVPPAVGLSAGTSDALLSSAVARPARPPAYLPAVDGLRGLAALVVVLFHLYGEIGAPDFRPLFHVNLLRPLHDLWCGVNLFLVLSGFCLFWPLVRNPQKTLEFFPFMGRRIRRIIPAYYAALILTPLLYITFVRLYHLPNVEIKAPLSGIDVVLHLLMLHSLNPDTIHSWHGPAWSLGLEWTWYLAFPLVVWLFRKAGPMRALLATLGITVVYRMGVYFYFGPSNTFPTAEVETPYALRVLLPGRLFEFGAGMFVAWWLANRPIPRAAVVCSMIGVPVLLTAAHMAEWVDPFIPARDLLYGTAFAMLLLLVVAPGGNAVSRVLGGKLFSGIGEYSYSLYLFHMPVVFAIAAPLRYHGYSRPSVFFALLLSFPIVCWVSKMAYLAFEKPFMAGKKATVLSAAVPCPA